MHSSSSVMSDKLVVQSAKVSISSRPGSSTPVRKAKLEKKCTRKTRPNSAILSSSLYQKKSSTEHGSTASLKIDERNSRSDDRGVKNVSIRIPTSGIASDQDLEDSQVIGDGEGDITLNSESFSIKHTDTPHPVYEARHYESKSKLSNENALSCCSTPRMEIPEPKSKATISDLSRHPSVELSTALDLDLEESTLKDEVNQIEADNDADKRECEKGSSDSRSKSEMSSCTVSMAKSITPDSLAETPAEFKEVKGYGDILQVLEKLENGMEPRIRQKNFNLNNENRESNLSSPSKSSSNGGDKISELFSYLDSVEKSVDTEQISSPIPKMGICKGKTSGTKINNVSDLAKEDPTKLAEKIVRLRFSLEEQERAVKVLREALEHQRKINGNMSAKFQKELDMRLKQQKDEFDATAKRHQSFIDQLIEDKKALSERCDHLHMENQKQERKHADNVRNLEHRHNAEIRRIKSLHETSNKLKQEKWMDEKTKRIKEQTVRGLEPEIQRLMARHSAEMSDLEAEKDRLLFNQERDLHARHVQHVRELKSLWEEEQHEAVQKERQSVTNRFQTQIKEINAQHESELERLQELLERERSRSAEERFHFEREAELIRKIANDRAEKEIERIKEEEEGKRRASAKKHATELSLLKENESTEKAEFEIKCRQQMEQEWQSKEATLSEKFRKEKNEELDKIVKKLEADIAREKKQAEEDMEERINKTRAKLEVDLKESEKECANLREKLTKVREGTSGLEEENIVLKASLKQKEIMIEELQNTNARLESERVDVQAVVRGEFATALDNLEQERTKLLNELSEMRLKLAELRSEKEAGEKERRREMEAEVERIHEKIRLAISRKNEIIEDLRRNYEQALEQVEHLESTLERQAKEKHLFRKK